MPRTPRIVLFRRHVLAAVLLAFAAASGAHAQKWEPHSYPQFGFRAEFPSEPKLESQSQDSQEGPTIHLHSYCAQLSTTYLCVAVIDQGEQAAASDPDLQLARMKHGVLAGATTKLVAEKPIDLDGHRGIELEAVNDTVRTSTRIYLAGATIYQTMVVSPAAETFAGTARFLDSFRLIRRSGN